MTDVKLPVLLDDRYQPVRRVRALEMSVELRDTDLSTATLVVPIDEAIAPLSCLRLYTAYGDIGIFRVQSLENDYQAKTQTLDLESILTLLDDSEIRRKTAFWKPFGECVSKALEYQDVIRFQLGTISSTLANNNICLDGSQTILSAILSIVQAFPDHRLVVDDTTYPFTLNIIQQPSVVSCEARVSRNIESVNISYDISDMVTRVYNSGLDFGYMDAPGARVIISRDIDLSHMGPTQKRTFARNYLLAHCKPSVSVQISGRDLSKLTGLSIDHFELGKLCRLALPEYNETVEARITAVTYDDVFNAPDAVQISLANLPRDMSITIRKASGGGGGGGFSSSDMLGGNGVGPRHSHYITCNESEGGTVTITIGTASTTENSANFNMASTSWYAQQVEGLLETGWANAVGRITWPSAGTTTSFTVIVPAAYGEEESHTFTIQKGANPGPDGYASVALGQTVVGRIPIGDWYSAGETDGEGNVTLSASGWTGPNATNTVTASNGEEEVVRLPPFTVSGGDSFNSAYQTTVTFSTASASAPLGQKVVDASNLVSTARSEGWTAGYNDGVPSSAALGNYVSGTDWKVTVTKGNGSTVDLTVDMGRVYTMARIGWTQGTFSPATVTPQGAAHSVTPISGTALKLSADVMYDGNGSTYTVQGTQITALAQGKSGPYVLASSNQAVGRTYYGTLYDLDDDDRPVRRGSGSWFLVQGNTSTLYPRVNNYNYAERDVYAAGTTTVTDRGSAQPVYVPSSNGTDYYQAGTPLNLYDAGTPDSTTYYTKSGGGN